MNKAKQKITLIKSNFTLENYNSLSLSKLRQTKSQSNLTPIKSTHHQHFTNNENINLPHFKTPEEYQKRIKELEDELQYILIKVHNQNKDSSPGKKKLQSSLNDSQINYTNALKTLNEELNRKLIELKHHLKIKDKTIKSLSDLVMKLKQKVIDIQKEKHTLEDVVLQQEDKIKELNETLNLLFKDIKRKTLAIKDSKNYISILEQSLKEFKGDQNDLNNDQKKDIVHQAEMCALKEQIDKYVKENQAQANKIKLLEQHHLQLRSRPKNKDKLICKSMSYACSDSKENRYNNMYNDSIGSCNNTNISHNVTILPSKSNEHKKIILSYTDCSKRKILNNNINNNNSNQILHYKIP